MVIFQGTHCFEIYTWLSSNHIFMVISWNYTANMQKSYKNMKMQMLATRGKVKPYMGNITSLKSGCASLWTFKWLSCCYGKIIYNLLYTAWTNSILVDIVHTFENSLLVHTVYIVHTWIWTKIKTFNNGQTCLFFKEDAAKQLIK